MSKVQESFIVSARKYRPETWKQVIGQEAITETLHKSIAQDHLAHAYLFCGPRGVGKTTCARIFAKEINRTEDHQEDEDFSFNIFELDAASNNSVDDIRSLTDQVRIPPQVGKYKVYIIDEVHMLSKAAFNAFLKTLEEPPKHAIFILATTEKHKILPTILSRCQIYDFNRIGIDDIVLQLKHIANKESITFEEEALHIIAQKADGAMRDALSIFDQLSSFTNANLSYDAVLRNLHVLDYDYFFGITQNLYEQDFAEALVVLDSILKQGFDGHHFIAGLGSHFRDLLVCKVQKTIHLLEVGDSVKQKYAQQSQAIDSNWLIEALKQLNETEFRYRNATNHRLLIETTLLTLASLNAEKKNSTHEQVKPLTAPTQKKQLLNSAQEAHHETAEKPEIPRQVVAAEVSSKGEGQNETLENPTPSLENDLSVESKPPVPAQPQTETAGKRKRRTPSTVSLKMVDSEVESTESPGENAALQPDVEAEQSHTVISSLSDAWKKITEDFLSEGKSALYSILAKQKISNDMVEEVIVHLAHEVDEEEFSLHSADLLTRLRLFTGNNKLRLSTTRSKEETATKLFTPNDKFEYLAKQNPLLNKMKTDLDLDITY